MTSFGPNLPMSSFRFAFLLYQTILLAGTKTFLAFVAAAANLAF